MKNSANVRGAVVKLAKLSMLAAISIVLVWLIRIPAPAPISFLIYDPADVSILIAAFAFGPVEGLILTLVVSLLQSLLISTDFPYGFIMHTVATGTLVCVVSLIYHKMRTRKGAVIALICGTLSMAAIMIPANLFITPFFMGAERSLVVSLLPPIILFNLVKAGLNCLLTFLLYKRISGFLKKN